MCLMFMMPKSKLRHTFNRCYASFNFAEIEFLVTIKTWIQPLPDPSNNKNLHIKSAKLHNVMWLQIVSLNYYSYICIYFCLVVVLSG
jgi:hypothetical protein